MIHVPAQSISVKKVEQSCVSTVDINAATMGIHFTDHMFVCDYENGQWSNPRIEQLAPIATHPSAMALHYGQAIFEGLKATMGKNGPVLFRPQMNAQRLNESAQRLGMPDFPEDLFLPFPFTGWAGAALPGCLYLHFFLLYLAQKPFFFHP